MSNIMSDARRRAIPKVARPTQGIAALDARDALGNGAKEGVDFDIYPVHGPIDRWGLTPVYYEWREKPNG